MSPGLGMVVMCGTVELDQGLRITGLRVITLDLEVDEPLLDCRDDLQGENVGVYKKSRVLVGKKSKIDQSRARRSRCKGAVH
jgi:hypothetical protein